MKKKFIILLLASLFLLTGCTNTLVDKKGDVVKNEKTETNVIENIICKPVDGDLTELYRKSGKDISKLPACEDVKILKWHDGIWNTVFVYPIAVLFIKVGLITNNLIFSIMLLAIIARLVEFSSSKKIAENEQKVKKIQPELDEINKRFEGKTDSASTIEKGDAIKKLYMDNNIKPMAGFFAMFIQFPILFAIIEVMYRVPLATSSNVFGINLGTAPIVGIKNGELIYLCLSLLMIILAFLQSFIKTVKAKYEKRDFIMTGIIVFIVSSLAFSLPSGVAIYLTSSYLMGLIQKLIIRHNLSKKLKTNKI